MSQILRSAFLAMLLAAAILVLVLGLRPVRDYLDCQSRQDDRGNPVHWIVGRRC